MTKSSACTLQVQSILDCFYTHKVLCLAGQPLAGSAPGGGMSLARFERFANHIGVNASFFLFLLWTLSGAT